MATSRLLPMLSSLRRVHSHPWWELTVSCRVFPAFSRVVEQLIVSASPTAYGQEVPYSAVVSSNIQIFSVKLFG